MSATLGGTPAIGDTWTALLTVGVTTTTYTATVTGDLAADVAAALAEQRFSLNRMVDISATAPAKMFGLYPQKGTIAVGGDADIAIVDPAATTVVSASSR